MMEWHLMLWASTPRRPTAPETITTLLLLLPFLSSLLYRLYAKIKRRDGRSVGLQILSDASNDGHVKYEIVAVHGLGANPEHTWTCKSELKSKVGDTQPRVHLLKDLLMKDERFSDARILHFAYNSDWLVDACFESARDIGLRLMESLIEHRKNHARLPLIFVGHSFGGIVIKEALSSDPKDTQRIVEDTCGIIFLGTPHLGSPVAGFGATVAYLTGFLGSNTGLLLLLRSNGEMLVNLSVAFQECLESKFRNLDKRTKIISICEQKPTYLLNWLYAGMIVPLHSAAFGTNFMDVVKVDKDHSGLNKCHNSEDLLYKELTEQLDRLRPTTPPKINTLQQAVLDRLMPPITVSDAEFHPGLDEYGRGSSECLPQTREEILKEICDWLDDSTSTQKHLYWLQGKAGTGKTTIARTVVSRMAEKNRIVANFFFKRGEGDRARLKRFFITLAAQLVRKSPHFAKAIQDALESDPSLPEQRPKIQFRKFIQEPVQRQNFKKSKAIIVIIDALDECDSNEDLATLVQLINEPVLPDGSSAQLPIKYFLTSRFDHHTQPISDKTLEQKCEKKELQSATSATVKRDIELYLRYHLKIIDGLLDATPAGDQWSNPSNFKLLKELTERAYPLFEFAAAACRFIAQTNIPGGPRERLNNIMESQTSGDLDMVYESILKQRFYNLKGQPHKSAKVHFQKVIGSVISLADSVDVGCLAQLTELSEQAIRQELHHFESVLVVPTEQNSRSPVRLFHESFRDFLTGPETNEEFKVDSITAHKLLGSRCRQILCESLKENICNLESPGTDRSEVADETINTFIPLQLQYACRFLVHHIKRSNSIIKDGDKWHSFLLSHFLNWLEALSLLGRMSESASLVTDLKTVSDGVEVKAFLEDAERLILYFRHVVDIAPLQLYSSVLIFAPKNSVIRQVFGNCRAKWISHVPNVDSQWSPCLQTIEGHIKEVTCVAISSDGLLASSGGIDDMIKIWDPISGICLQTLFEPDIVYSLAFSQDGRLACRTTRCLYVWDIRRGICLQELSLSKYTNLSELTIQSEGSMIFTDEQKLMVAGIGLRRIITSAPKGEFEEQLNPAFDDTPMILSSDGQLVAYIKDRKIMVFNTSAEPDNSLKVLENDGKFQSLYWEAIFSPDNRSFVSRQLDLAVIKVWDISSTIYVQTISGNNAIDKLAFSPDSRLLGTGHGDGKIIIWDWKNGTRLKTFTGHKGIVGSLAFSSNGAWLASASLDKTIKIWDNLAHTSNEKSMSDSKTEHIKMAMDGQRLVTLLSNPDNFQVWDILERKCIDHPFRNQYCQVAISANGGIIAAVTLQGYVVEIWDVGSGDFSIVRDGHLSPKCSIALSENGERFITSFKEGFFEVRESRTGHLLKAQQCKSALSNNDTSPAISFDGEQIAWKEKKSFSRDRICTNNVCTNVLRELQGWHNVIYFSRSLAFSRNGQRLAAIGSHWDGAIWDVATGACLRAWDAAFKKLWYGFELHPGFINFDFTKAADSPVLENWEDCLARYYLSPDGVWVMRSGRRALWIPPEYRPKDAAASGSNIAVARTSGRPYVIGFSDDGL